ncbi:MAG: alpha/beta hydrolase [Verrucomicrobiaceae bacterium]|nr:MAG: alpha/beta hydrolase [Verrucomicrobiaceae bacterium]
MIKLLLLLLSLLPVLSGCSQYATISEINPVLKPASHTVGTLELARKNIITALTRDSKNSEAALAGLLSATEIAASELKRHPDNMDAREAYNFALARVFTQLRASKISAWDRPLTVSGSDGVWELSGTTPIAKEAALGKFEFIPADQIQVGGTYTSKRLLKEGLGAPLVAVLADASELQKRDKFVQGRQICYGVTAVARFEGRRCIVSFEDPLSSETTVLGNRPYPLAADYTAPLAMMLVKVNPKKMELTRLLRPGKYAETARLARLQPYDPKKIPVICVHGLMDSPATWIPLINTLRADPAIRANYQFWFFSYPSGYPYQHSAAILRRQMDAIKKQYPDHKDAVLIGHSMGGCITRLMITDTGDRIWKETFKQSPAQTKLSPETRQLLTDALIFKKREDVARAILIAAPLRGSDLASGWLGRFGSRLVHSPVTLVKAGGEALQSVRTSGDYVGPTRIPNSVDTMSPKNRFVQFINKIEPSRDIPYHVIVGDRGKGGNPDHTKPSRGDGFVPYWSSHMDGAASELIVPSNHSAHQNPQAIAEVMRILKLHARTSSDH